MPTLDDIPIIPTNAALKANDSFPANAVLSTASSKVVQVPLALIGQGFTHAFRIDFNNSELDANTTNDLDESITLMAIPANCVVNKARLVVVTAFTGITTCNAFVGRTADADGYIAPVSVLAKTVVENTGVYIDVVNELDVITASGQNLVIVFDPGSNTQAVGSLTAGSLVVLLSLTEIADYANITTAKL